MGRVGLGSGNDVLDRFQNPLGKMQILGDMMRLNSVAYRPNVASAVENKRPFGIVSEVGSTNSALDGGLDPRCERGIWILGAKYNLPVTRLFLLINVEFPIALFCICIL